MKMNEWEWAAWIFVILGAINWGLVGIFNFDLVQVIFSTSPLLKQTLYGLIGASGFYLLYKVLTVKK